MVELMSAPFTVNIAELIDQHPLGRLQIRIIVLCGLVVAAFLGWQGLQNHLVMGQLFRHLYDVGDQRSLDTNVASESRN